MIYPSGSKLLIDLCEKQLTVPRLLKEGLGPKGTWGTRAMPELDSEESNMFD